MLHFVEITLYVIISIALILKATQRPIWGVGYYMLNFFAQPNYWKWGPPLTNPSILRWSLYSALLLMLVTLATPSKTRFRSDRESSRSALFLILMVLNAFVVHLGFAYDADESWKVFVEMFKFSVLFFLVVATIRTKHDFILLLSFFTIGLGYWGFEARFVGLPPLVDGRLEGFGGPGCANSNELASITATLLPLIGGLLFLIRGFRRVLGVIAAGLALNILMLCNSRGGFVGLFCGAITLPVLSTGKARRLAINGLVLGAVGFFLLAGNPQILKRFMTTFIEDKQARNTLDEDNKRTRKAFWAAALDLISDSPFGNGGGCFKSGMGNPYIAKRGLATRNRSCHQGYLEEAMSWGVQGLLFRMGFIVCAGVAALKASRFRTKIGDPYVAFCGVCILAGFSVNLITSMFGDFLQMEWGYWLCITAVAYAKVFGEKNYGLIPDAIVNAEESASSASAAQPLAIPAGVS